MANCRNCINFKLTRYTMQGLNGIVCCVCSFKRTIQPIQHRTGYNDYWLTRRDHLSRFVRVSTKHLRSPDGNPIYAIYIYIVHKMAVFCCCKYPALTSRQSMYDMNIWCVFVCLRVVHFTLSEFSAHLRAIYILSPAASWGFAT